MTNRKWLRNLGQGQIICTSECYSLFVVGLSSFAFDVVVVLYLVCKFSFALKTTNPCDSTKPINTESILDSIHIHHTVGNWSPGFYTNIYVCGYTWYLQSLTTSTKLTKLSRGCRLNHVFYKCWAICRSVPFVVYDNWNGNKALGKLLPKIGSWVCVLFHIHFLDLDCSVANKLLQILIHLSRC